jgi:hypothetical protein
VESLDDAFASFSELGLNLEGRMMAEREWAGRVKGLGDQRVEISMMSTRDGHGRLEFSRFLAPPVISDHRNAAVNALGYLRAIFTVSDLTKLSLGFVRGVRPGIRAAGAERPEVVAYSWASSWWAQMTVKRRKRIRIRIASNALAAQAARLNGPPDRLVCILCACHESMSTYQMTSQDAIRSALARKDLALWQQRVAELDSADVSHNKAIEAVNSAKDEFEGA